VTNTPVAVAFYHIPIRAIHPKAEGASRAAICAEEQGRFDAMHHHLMGTSGWLTDTNWLAAAHAVGVPDIKKFSTCLGSPATTARLTADSAAAAKAGVRATPWFLTSRAVQRGASSTAVLRALLNK
jgi:protein-disulfide isomerase